MDTQYLVWLQGLRAEYGVVETFLTLVTDATGSLAAILPAIIFWCINKRAGQFIFFTFACALLFNRILKNTFCVYRTWIFNEEVIPIDSVLESSDGYAFPSGHTCSMTAIFGSIAYYYRKKFPLLILPCAVIIILAAFSRNFLGAHTPQEVLAGILAAFLVVIFSHKVMDWSYNDRPRENFILVAGIIIAVAAAAYLVLKNYPVDYFNGKVIVDPIKSQASGIGAVGTFTGMLLGLELERRLVNFQTDVSISMKLLRLVIGGIIFAATNFLLIPVIKHLDIGMFAKFLQWFTLNLSITFIAPLIFSSVERKFL